MRAITYARVSTDAQERDGTSLDTQERACLAFARERGWRNLRFYATVGDDFPRAYRGLAPNGDEWASLDVWEKRDGVVRHFWGASESGGTADPGQDPHLAPDPTPLWNILDWTPGDRGTDWYPKLDYGADA
jgi:predicted dithiol-disulfide oxidoreductase (DUF899 family)